MNIQPNQSVTLCVCGNAFTHILTVSLCGNASTLSLAMDFECSDAKPYNCVCVCGGGGVVCVGTLLYQVLPRVWERFENRPIFNVYFHINRFQGFKCGLKSRTEVIIVITH